MNYIPENKIEKRKITVKHYLNLRAKPQMVGREKFFPLYIQIIVNGKKAQIKSRLNEYLNIYRSDIERLAENNDRLIEVIAEGYLSEKFMQNISRKKAYPLYHLLNDEVDTIKRVIIYLKPFNNENFTLVNFGHEYQLHTTEITKIIDDHIKDLYRKELRDIFLKTIDHEDKSDIFRYSNYFIHFINWNNSFSSFYDATFEVMPQSLKAVENLLSNELRVSIKAYLAYKTKINILNRLFERRDAGRISTLSFLDWQTSIKDSLHKEFGDLFGEQRALEYIVSLDNILNNVINS